MGVLNLKRQEMIERHLKGRGITDEHVLAAMQEIPREEFVSSQLVEFAYEDSALPIEEQQTISQPYIVALMAELLALGPDDRVLDVGTGSGYAAAVMSRIVSRVYTVERHKALADSARKRFEALGLDNIEVLHGDGSRGWSEHAPFDAINVAAGGTRIPEPLKEQLAEGGRLIIPVGESSSLQRLVRLTREDGQFESENLGHVRFVPLLSDADQADASHDGNGSFLSTRPAQVRDSVVDMIGKAAEPFDDIETADLDSLMARIGDARVVLLGESTHGTAEFYEMRARITRELLTAKNFNIVAVEADWPDAAQVDRFIRGTEISPTGTRAFDRFPTWMWLNQEVRTLVQWLKNHNDSVSNDAGKVGFYGLDLYSLYSSIDAVIRYLEQVDPELARLAVRRYGCLSPYEKNPAAYGAAALSGRFRACEDDVAHVLTGLLEKNLELAAKDGERFQDAVHNARLVANAEKYYRAMYEGARASWNQRDSHMFETLESLLNQDEGNKAVVWAHNSHLGNAAATEMGVRGEHNLGQLAKNKYGRKCYSIGFSTDHGTVAAADDWDGPVQIKSVRPALDDSYERLMHQTGIDRFMLPLHRSKHEKLNAELADIRLERAIGVIYRPQTELQSHYFQASLTNQFDEWIWFDESRAVTPLEPFDQPRGAPDTFPFGL